MALPTSPLDQNLPKGPNFLYVVIAFAVAILLLLLGAWILLGHRSKKLMPVDTHATPSQTRLQQPARMWPGEAALAASRAA